MLIKFLLFHCCGLYCGNIVQLTIVNVFNICTVFWTMIKTNFILSISNDWLESRPCANYAAVVKENNARSRLRAEVIIYLVISFLHSRNFTQMFVLKILSGHNLASQALYLHFPPRTRTSKAKWRVWLASLEWSLVVMYIFEKEWSCLLFTVKPFIYWLFQTLIIFLKALRSCKIPALLRRGT